MSEKSKAERDHQGCLGATEFESPYMEPLDWGTKHVFLFFQRRSKGLIPLSSWFSSHCATQKKKLRFSRVFGIFEHI